MSIVTVAPLDQRQLTPTPVPGSALKPALEPAPRPPQGSAPAAAPESARRPAPAAAGSPSTPPVHLMHIAYSEATRSAEDGFTVLDNMANARPDWYELWPVRRWLHSHELDEQAYYGFFSPKFRAKTQLGSAEVRALVQADGAASDVYLFCAQPDVGMFFRHVYEGAGVVYPGVDQSAQQFFARIGYPTDMSSLVMDSSTIVFSNYVVARPRYWRAWLAIADLLYHWGERPHGDALTDGLNTPTTYGDGVQRKVFVAEGIASMLCSSGVFKTHAWDPFAMPWFSVFSRFRDQAITADALKKAYRQTGQQAYLDAFVKIQREVLSQFGR